MDTAIFASGAIPLTTVITADESGCWRTNLPNGGASRVGVCRLQGTITMNRKPLPVAATTIAENVASQVLGGFVVESQKRADFNNNWCFPNSAFKRSRNVEDIFFLYDYYFNGKHSSRTADGSGDVSAITVR